MDRTVNKKFPFRYQISQYKLTLLNSFSRKKLVFKKKKILLFLKKKKTPELENVGEIVNKYSIVM